MLSNDIRSLLKNASHLGLLQGLNFLIPLLTVPYLLRVLGVENFGLLSFATVVCGYLALVADYGFNLSATREVAVARDDKAELNRIVTSVYIIKFVLLLLGFLVLLALTQFVVLFEGIDTLVYLSFLLVIGQALFPVWLFQGLERMDFISAVTAFLRAGFGLSVFVFVQSESDLLLVPVLGALGYIASAVWALWRAYSVLNVTPVRVSRGDIVARLRSGWHVFTSTIAMSLYTLSGTLFLGLFAGPAAAGYFAACERLIAALKGAYQPFSQALYPFLAFKLNTTTNNHRFLRRLLAALTLGMLTLCGALFLFSDLVAVLVFGSETSAQGEGLILTLAFVPLAVALSNLFGIQLMLNLGYQRQFSRIIWGGALVGLSLNAIMAKFFGASGVAGVLLGIEVGIAIAMGWFITTRRVGFWKS